MKLINGTAHEVVLYNKEDCLPHPKRRGAFLVGNAQPVEFFPAGKNLMAEKEKPQKTSVGGRLFTKRGKFTSADPLPGGADEIVFASNMYLCALKDIGISTEGRVATPLGPVYAEDSATRPCGIADMEVG